MPLPRSQFFALVTARSGIPSGAMFELCVHPLVRHMRPQSLQHRPFPASALAYSRGQRTCTQRAIFPHRCSVLLPFVWRSLCAKEYRFLESVLVGSINRGTTLCAPDASKCCRCNPGNLANRRLVVNKTHGLLRAGIRTVLFFFYKKKGSEERSSLLKLALKLTAY